MKAPEFRGKIIAVALTTIGIGVGGLAVGQHYDAVGERNLAAKFETEHFPRPAAELEANASDGDHQAKKDAEIALAGALIGGMAMAFHRKIRPQPGEVPAPTEEDITKPKDPLAAYPELPPYSQN